jgi:hypothetical protein
MPAIFSTKISQSATDFPRCLVQFNMPRRHLISNTRACPESGSSPQTRFTQSVATSGSSVAVRGRL